MSTASPTVRPEILPTVPCQQCSAPLPVDPALPAVACAYCRVETAVSHDLRSRAATHNERLREAWAQALNARLAELSHQKGERTAPLFWRWFLVASLSAPLILIVLFSKVLSHLPLYAGISFVVLAGFIWSRFVETFVGLFTLPSVALVLGSGIGECRACGAPVEIPEGAVTIDCAHCRSTVITTMEIRRAALEQAHRRVRAMGLQRDRAAAKHFAVYEDARATYGVGGSVSTVATVLLIAGALVLTAGSIVLMQSLPRKPGDTPTAWISAVIVAGTAALVVRFVLALRRVHREALAYRAVLGHVPAMRRPPVV